MKKPTTNEEFVAQMLKISQELEEQSKKSRALFKIICCAVVAYVVLITVLVNY